MAATTRAAAGHLTIRADVAQYPPERFAGAEGLIFSPPCPTFSHAGKGSGRDDMGRLHAVAEGVWRYGWQGAGTGWGDPRTPIVLEPLRWAEAIQPTWIALEQVPLVLPLWEQYAAIWADQGWSTWCGLLNAADYGVPQTRERAILMAHRSRPALPPEPTHAEHPTASLFGEQRRWASMADAVGWPESWSISQQRGSGMVERHGERPRRRANQPAFTVTGSEEGSSLGRWLLHTGANTMKHSRRTEDVVPYTRPIDRPAPTVDTKAHGSWRVLNGETVRRVDEHEVAAFQDFPPDYPWQGNKSQRGQQIGNAIPPGLAAAVVGALTGRQIGEVAA